MSAPLHRPPHFPTLVRTLASRGINQRTIARKLDVAPSTVCRWASQEREPRGRHAVGLLFLALDVAQKQSHRA